MKPYAQTDNYTLYLGDAWEVLDSLAENSVDAVVTDPPYEIGFMNKGWDNTRVAFNRTTWEKVLRVLKPGGHLLAFNHSRTFHRMAVAIEDAGFEIRDTIMWLYGSGFPKSHDISKAIDRKRDDLADIEIVVRWLESKRVESKITRKEIEQHFGTTNMGQSLFTITPGSSPRVATWEQWIELKKLLNFDNTMDSEVWRLNGRKGKPGEAWAEREVIGKHPQPAGSKGNTFPLGQDVDITTAATDEAKQWEGWGTALKPAYEPILMARKPIPSTVADNVLTYGVGGINIDGCRVGSGSGETKTVKYPDIKGNNYSQGNESYSERNNVEYEVTDNGRFPANVIHDGSEEATSDMWDTETDNDASRYFYTAKASKKDRDEGVGRNTHPTVKPTDLMQYLIRLIAPKGTTVLDLFMGSGSTGKAAMIENAERDSQYHFIGIDTTADYLPIAEARIEFGLHYLAEKPKADGVVHIDQIDLFTLL